MSFNEERYALFLKIKNDCTDDVIQMLKYSRSLSINSSLNNFEWTSLHLAAYQGNLALVKYLLDNGADSSTLNRSGYTPLMLAESRSHDEIVDLISKVQSHSVQFPIIEASSI